jgi:hypothetical protein
MGFEDARSFCRVSVRNKKTLADLLLGFVNDILSALQVV